MCIFLIWSLCDLSLTICCIYLDFQKTKPTASVVADEFGISFRYEEVTLEFASLQTLNLIIPTIDDGPYEDWNSDLGIKLKHLIKTSTLLRK